MTVWEQLIRTTTICDSLLQCLEMMLSPGIGIQRDAVNYTADSCLRQAGQLVPTRGLGKVQEEVGLKETGSGKERKRKGQMSYNITRGRGVKETGKQGEIEWKKKEGGKKRMKEDGETTDDQEKGGEQVSLSQK